MRPRSRPSPTRRSKASRPQTFESRLFDKCVRISLSSEGGPSRSVVALRSTEDRPQFPLGGSCGVANTGRASIFRGASCPNLALGGQLCCARLSPLFGLRRTLAWAGRTPACQAAPSAGAVLPAWEVRYSAFKSKRKEICLNSRQIAKSANRPLLERPKCWWPALCCDVTSGLPRKLLPFNSSAGFVRDPMSNAWIRAHAPFRTLQIKSV
jgi:hypothetical protein